MMTKDEIVKALGNIDVSTAIGRMELEKRSIPINAEPEIDVVADAAEWRVRGYISVYNELCELVKDNKCGIMVDELERVEFIREQLYDLAKTISNRILDYRMR